MKVMRGNVAVGSVSKIGKFYSGYYLYPLRFGASKKIPIRYSNKKDLARDLHKIRLSIKDQKTS